MKKIFFFLAIVFSISVLSAEAQRTKYYKYADSTITNADTLTYELSTILNGESNSSWQVKGTNVSGTTAFTVYKQQSNTPFGNMWTTVQSWTATDTVINAAVTGKRERLYIISTGTQSTTLQVANVLDN